MRPPPNRDPSRSSNQGTDSDAPALAPDTTGSGADSSIFQSADAIRKLFESGSSGQLTELFASQDIEKFDRIFKSGDTTEIEKLLKSSDSQKLLSLLPLPSLRNASRGNTIGSLPGVFESKDWASSLAPAHVDIDTTAVFRSEDSTALPAKHDDAKGTDWNAMFEAGLPKIPAPLATTSMAEDCVDENDLRGTIWTEGSIPKYPPPPVRTTRSSSIEHQKTQQQNQSLVPEQVQSVSNALPSGTRKPLPSGKQSQQSNSRARAEPVVKTYFEPSPGCVLLGRGGRSNNSSGNRNYLAAKKDIQPRYLAASKQEKTAISQELVDRVHAWGGRFLELDPTNNKWFEISELKARKKASQTLRELNTPEERAAKRARYGK